ncbi:MAG: beta-lactamase family protein [Proteobacteria bacterium]|nr:beta-lactamase family protein [Pseudomonadota bacterium]
MAAAAAAAAAPPREPVVIHTDPHLSRLPAVRIDDTLKSYSAWLDQLAASNRVAGLATAVIVDDRVRFEHTVGYADAQTGEKVQPDTAFRLASLSKAFATALTGILVRDGVLNWDTRLSDVLPFFKLKDAHATEQATVRDILGQRLGLPRNAYDNMLSSGVPYQELARRLDEVNMSCGVGDCYGYQNVAFSLIGDVIYADTGDFFYHLVDKRLFLPLGMTDATYGRDGLESSKSWARPHYRRGNAWVAFEPNDNFYVPPAAGVNASVRDMEQWLIAQMGGRPMVLPESLLDVLHAPGIDTPSERYTSPWRRARVTDAHYALGWRVYDYAGHTLIFHAGAVQGYRAEIGFFPEYHIGMVVMWNCECAEPAGLMPMVFDKLLGLPEVDWAGLNAPVRAARPAPQKHKRSKRAKH